MLSMDGLNTVDYNETLNGSKATHVVTGIEYGATVFITLFKKTENVTDTENELEHLANKITSKSIPDIYFCPL